MTPEQFTYWLQGYSEICGKNPSKEQWKVIEDHLKMVFEKQTPERRRPYPVSDPGAPHIWRAPRPGEKL